MEVERQSQQEKASQPADSQLERKSVPAAESMGGGNAEEEPHQSSLSRPQGSALEKKEDEETDPNFSYKDVSQLSDATDDVYAESAVGESNDLRDYNRLIQQTKKRMHVVDEHGADQDSNYGAATEQGDEFIRNFFIKFGMRRTLESFQQEWFELKAKSALQADLPEIPQIYRRNAELSDELASLQEELDEARIIAEKARSTYDKLRKQRDFQKINHRRVQQEKQKMANDAAKEQKKLEDLNGTFQGLSNKFESAVKEKMLMKLEKDRLKARVENLELSMNQLSEDQTLDAASLDKQSRHDTSAALGMSAQKSGGAQQLGQPASTAAAAFAAKTNQPTPIPSRDRYNPALSEEFEGAGSHLSLTKTYKGHLMGVTSLSYNPKKDIIATGSDDTTWKLWSVPNGDLIMSGEGHIDWVGGVEFHPKGNLLATASGDGTVKIWDFVKACCAQTFAEHGQPVWKVAYHDTGDFLLSASMDHTVKLWDMNMSRSRFTFRGHVDSVNSIQFMPYSQVFVSGSGDKTVAMWDIRTSQNVQTFYGHNNAVNSSKFNIRGDKIVSADCDGITKVWDVRMVKEERSFDSGLTSANCAIFDKACQSVYVASEDASIKVFNLQTGEKDGELKGHEDSVLDLTFDSQREGYLVSASADCSFRIWQ